jgi:Na+:H+ antiporter, NhaA family
VGDWTLKLSLGHWVNDGLMAVFFFLVGLEIKREILFGALASLRRAALPVVAAIGGAVIPALIFLGFAAGTPYTRGWGVPMATDIAFAVTLLALLGGRAPLWLKSFVTALAIADDIMAVLVIAVFYTASLDLAALAWAALPLALLLVMNRTGLSRPGPYLAVALLLWFFVLQSGIHATIAGVAAAAFVPASRKRGGVGETGPSMRVLLGELDDAESVFDVRDAIDAREAVLDEIEEDAARHRAPLYRLEHAIHPWSAFLVLPVFAFANAGVRLPLDVLREALTHPLSLGIAAGLFVGKQLGITLFTWIAVRLRLGELAEGARWSQLWGGGLLAGIGFTMSIFIASLAFLDEPTLELAKIGIIAGSLLSAVVGMAVLRAVPVETGEGAG